MNWLISGVMQHDADFSLDGAEKTKANYDNSFFSCMKIISRLSLVLRSH